MSALKVHGADLSHHNPNPDLKRAKDAGLLFLYHKATEGTSVIDYKYTERRDAARKAGIPFGAYHFARPESNGYDAVEEARFFMRVADPQPGDLAPALDFEVSHPKAEEWCKKFMAEVKRLMKERDIVGKPIHYGPDDFGDDYKYLRWVPRYNPDNRRPLVRWDIHQFSGGATTPGTPGAFPGLGAVDLNNMRDKLSLSDFRLMRKVPEKDPKKNKVVRRIVCGHISMQFSDTAAQHTFDANKVFRRAAQEDYIWLTGTEAGPGAKGLDKKLAAAAKANGFKFFIPKEPTDAWVAVNQAYIKKGTAVKCYTPVIPGSAALKGSERKWGPKGVTAVEFETPDEFGLGKITVFSAHYLTGGRKVNQMNGDVNHWQWNKKLGQTICKLMIEAGKGSALAFYGGDQNMLDNMNKLPQGDTFFGGPVTSVGDELGKYYNTGHGPIDVIASYDKDNRVKAKAWIVYDDRAFFLNTDHFLCEAEFDVRELAAA